MDRSLSLRSTRQLVFRAALCAGLLVGCAPEGQGFAEQASDNMDAVTAEAALIVSSLDGMTATTTPEEAVNANAANAATFWTEGCFTFVIDGDSITYTLTGCSGPFGLVEVNGEITITYRMTRSSIGFDITTADLTIGEASVSYTVNADVATDARNVSVSSMGSITGRRGSSISYSSSYDLRYNASSECAGVDGSWSATVGAASWTTTVTNWQRCADRCPQSGGTVTYSGPARSVTLTYDGSDQVSWTSDSGGSGEVELFCSN